jgi:glycosyltransferase involved in cell wall biosynthesis
MLAYALESRLIQRRIDRQLVLHGASVVHIHCVSSNAFYAFSAARRLCLPLVVTLHGELTGDADDIYHHSRVLPKLLTRLMAEADAVTACSNQTLIDAVDFTGVAVGSRGTIIRGGVDIEEFSGAEPERRPRPYMLTAGRLVQVKGLDVLIDAYRLVLERHPAAPDLVIAGDGDERAELERRAAALGIADRVEFAGRCDRARVARLFKGCTLFVLPSHYEGSPLVNVEAMAVGKPVIATRVGGVAEVVIDGETGLLTAAGDPAGLADALCRLLENPGLAEKLGKAGRREVATLDWPNIAERYDSVYESACARAAYRKRQ